MAIDEVERIYKEFQELEKKQDLERLKWALRFGDIEKAREITKKHHEKKLEAQELSEMRKMIDELKDQE